MDIAPNGCVLPTVFVLTLLTITGLFFGTSQTVEFSEPMEPPIVVTPQIEVDTAPPPQQECPAYRVQAGDTLPAIALGFGVSATDIREANKLPASGAVKEGDVLIIPVENCIPLLDVASNATPTIIIPQTHVPAGMIVLRVNNVLAPGDLATEAVELISLGETVDLTGWQIEAPSGETYTFPPFQLFGNGLVRIYTGPGEDTPIALYWGLNEAQWAVGDSVVIIDADGDVQATYSITQ